jgi:glycosyltransferase involved in cell wall biosynthesis
LDNKNVSKKIAIIANIIPTYRESFYKKILSNKNYEIKIFVQKDLPEKIKTVHHKFKKNVFLCKYFSLGNEKLVLTYLPLLKILKNFDIFVVEGNPRYLSHFFLATLLLFFNKKVILWTMVHSSNNNFFRESIRLWWTKFFKYIFVYTDYEKKILINKNFNKHVIFPMNNGIDQDKIDRITDKIKKRIQTQNNTFLSCARLIKKNKFELAISAFAEISKLKKDFKWIIIGDGGEKRSLKKLVISKKLQKKIIFKGAIYNEKKLAPYFLKSICLIHPSKIGLTLMHAFGYGLPVITHSSKEFHNPEIAAFKNNHNGLFFKMDDVNSLKKCIIKFLNKNNLKRKFSKKCLDVVKHKYNSQVMATNFVKLVNCLEKK